MEFLTKSASTLPRNCMALTNDGEGSLFAENVYPMSAIDIVGRRGLNAEGRREGMRG